MTKWEYVHAIATDDKVQFVNNQRVGKYPLFGSVQGPDITEFLKKMGQEGWELVGMCTASENNASWRLVLKRPMA